MGAKSKYETHILPHLEKITKALSEGATQRSIFESLGISHSSWHEYLNDPEKVEFSEAFKKGQARAVQAVEHALYKSAMGFTYSETKVTSEGGVVTKEENTIKQQAPSNTAQIFYLCNRGDWKQKQEVTGNIHGTFKIIPHKPDSSDEDNG